MPPFDLAETDKLLSTTRAVRRRLDFERPVERSVLLDCIRLSQQAPTGSNRQGWRWVIVTEPEKRLALATLYRKAAGDYLLTSGAKADAAGAVESYDRLEYDGAPMFQEEPIEAKWRCTYLSETMRVCRVTSAPATAPQELGAPTRDGPGEEWRVYVKMDPWKAQEEIARLLDRPVPRGRGDSLDDMPDWARRGGVGGYGLRGGDGPAPMADGMR